jgi:hypothetical protein
VLATKVKLQILATHLLRAAKRLFGIPDFRYYALAEGIAEVCTTGAPGDHQPAPPIHPSSASLCSRFFWGFSWQLAG